MRIIGGQHRGRSIQAPRGRTTRPTSDRVREAIFSASITRLGSLEGLAVLDLFAGSGALGLEALSRGAAQATFVDRAPSCRKIIGRNLEQLELSERATLLCLPALSALELLQRRKARFTLVLADPPYAADAAAVLAAVVAADLLLPGGLLVLEHCASRPSLEAVAGLELTASKRYGDTQVSFYQRPAQSGPASCEPVQQQ